MRRAAGWCLLAWASTARAAPVDLRLAELAVEPKGFPRVRLHADVLDDEQAPVRGLDAGAFRVALDGSSCPVRKVTTVGEAREGVTAVLALDVSKSISAEKFDEMRGAARSYVDGMRDEDRTAVVAISTEPETIVRLTGDKEKLLGALDALHPVGDYTALFRAVHASAVEGSGPDATRQRFVLLMSDGKNEGEGFTVDDAIQSARDRQVPVVAVGYVVREKDRVFLANLDKIAARTGGRYFGEPGSGALKAAYLSAQAAARGRYRIEFDAAEAWGDGREHDLRLEVASAAANARRTMPAAARPKEPAQAAGTKKPSGEPQRRWPWVLVAGALVAIALGAWTVRGRAPVSHGPPIDSPSPRRVDAVESGPPVRTAQDARPQEVRGTPAPPPRREPPPTRFQAGDAGPVPELTVTEGTDAGRVVRVEAGGELELGADHPCHVILGDSKVSGRHASLAWAGSKLVVRDLGSTNGTFVNGERIAGPRVLRDGDVLRLGRDVFAVRVPGGQDRA